MAGLLEKLLRRRKAEHREAVKTFAEVVIELANGRESGLDEDALEIILETAGKALDDLQAEVAIEQERIELRERVRRARKARIESRELDDQAGERLREFEAAEAAYKSAIVPIDARRAVLADLIGQEIPCLRRLRELLPADAQQAVLEIRQQAGELRRRAEVLKERAFHNDGEAARLEGKIRRDSETSWQYRTDTRADRDAADQLQQRAVEHRQAAAELEQQAATLAEQAGKLIEDAMGI